MKRTEIINALQLAGEGQLINVRGWVRSRRGNKNVSFIIHGSASVKPACLPAVHCMGVRALSRPL